VTFLDKMKIDLHNYVQDKKTVTEYEVGFNQIVRFVPHVAYNDAEKARQFRQGLKPSIRHMLGAFSIVDFRTTVEQALGVEMQETYTNEIHKSSSRDLVESKAQSNGPIHKKEKSHRHHPYRGSSEQSYTTGESTPQYRAIPKPGMGMVCFRCGDPHRRRDCTWSGECSMCGQNHKDVVCRKNPNGKVTWEVIHPSSSSGTMHMLAAAPTTPYLPAPLAQQYLMAPPVASPNIPTPQSGAFWLPQTANPSASMVPFYSAPTGFATGVSTSSGIPGAHALPSAHGRNNGDVITGNMLINPFLQ
jgi:hypothetical protein